MLDGLLGRGFAAKCKSLIKATKARIELIRRKRSARERFLKKDIADLLANGLDTNAFGRTEGLMAELTLSSCYNYVEECCGLLCKKLPEMQKQSECPADCKEAVASLVFSAARFSDLPELRDLREAFQEKYGNSLQYCVNQKFVAALASSSPTMEKKIQLMQDIAAEYSVSWNCRAFEKQMSKLPVHVKTSQYGSVPLPLKDKLKGDGGNSTNQKDHILSKVNYENSSNRNGSRPRNGNGTAEDIYMQSLRRPVDEAKGKTDDEPKSVKAKNSHQLHGITTSGQSSQLGRSSPGKEQDHIHKAREMKDNGAVPSPKREMQQTVSHLQQVIHTPIERLEVHQGKGNHKDNSTNLPNARKSQEADKLNARSFNKMIPPPYVKPPKVVKTEMVSDLQHTGYNGNDASGSSKAASSRTSSSINRADGIQRASNYEKEISCSSKGMGNGHVDVPINYNDSASDHSLPIPKSVRRHSSRPASGHDDVTGNHETGKTEKRSSSSRKRSDRKQGLQILFDDEPPVKDDERVLDKLLIHFSRKPTNFDPEKLRKMSDVQPPRQMPIDPKDTRRPHVERRLKPGNVTPLAPRTRSVSLPHESVLPEPAKVFSRAASFQPDRPAKHVHPNLPDCDDLAARIAALRGSY